MWRQVFAHIITALVIFQLLMIGLILLKGNYIAGILVCPISKNKDSRVWGLDQAGYLYISIGYASKGAALAMSIVS